MARDLDFHPPRNIPTNAPAPNRLPKPAIPKKRSVWPITLLIIIGVILLLIGLYWQFLRPSPMASISEQKDIKETTSNNPISGTKVDGNIFAAADGPHIQIYNAGSGETALNLVVKKLEAADYNVENLDKSQFEYDKTYIWYHAENLDLAKKIAVLLNDRSVVLKESKTYGIFDLLIWLGKS